MIRCGCGAESPNKVTVKWERAHYGCEGDWTWDGVE